jgi:uncharacterized membrane protein YdjX (TVP38/TMEM64 family)
MSQFWIVYVTCEMLGVPAFPLTMSAGALFGVAKGTALVSTAGVTAAGAAFLLARYALRERVAAWLPADSRWGAIDRALGKNSLKVITLLRLSPLMPFSLSNYFYGCTTIKLPAFLAGSWLGMLPGTAAYVAAGSAGRAVAEHGVSAQDAGMGLSVLGGLAFAAASATYIGKLVKDTIAEEEAESAKDAKQE